MNGGGGGVRLMTSGMNGAANHISHRVTESLLMHPAIAVGQRVRHRLQNGPVAFAAIYLCELKISKEKEDTQNKKLFLEVFT